MKLKKKLTTLFGFLLSVFLLTGCSPEMEDLALDVLTEVVSEIDTETEETQQEVLTEVEESSEVITGTEKDTVSDETVPDETIVIDETVIDETVTDETIVTDDVIDESAESAIVESGTYTSKEEVAAYLYAYGHLPSNFITKKEARNLGWVSNEGNLWEVAPGMSIGGDYFGNYEGNLPKAKGRDYYECDIDTDGSYRGAKRIVFSNDGLIYYTEDHYETFELLYGEE